MLNRIYYLLKPYLPWSARIAMRRWWAARLLRDCQDVWPIQESTAQKPPGWPGWPEGKDFAVVLTHDVEGQSGYERVRALAEVEMAAGFRSSFNLVPAGEYEVADELRAWLTERGFEVGIHDLHHDGHLFASREAFRRQAGEINEVLKRWKAVGFRAGFMHHNLEWQHDLEVLYDASTFDTDPFEPQPGGAGTIFPFWVEPPTDRRGGADARPGYVELPYTLPQDSTLFRLLQERDIGLWLRKLDWIAARGGMVLLNVHPDYITYDGAHQSGRTFPVSWYADFLRAIRERYAGRYWHALPRDVATWVRSFKPPAPPMKPKSIAMLSYSFYESDNRVRRYAETLAARGDRVEVFALSRAPELPKTEVLKGVLLHRLQARRRDEKGALTYALRLLKFLAISSVVIGSRFPRRRYDLIHVHNVPDFLVFAAWLPKLFGTKLILDIHDIVPEFFANKFKVSADATIIRALRWVERLSAHFADHVIISNHLWYEKFVTRSIPAARCSVFINHVDDGHFYPRPRTRKDHHPVIVFPGGLQWHQGLDIAIRAFPRLLRSFPEAQLHIYGDGDQKTALQQLTAELNLQGAVLFREPVPFTEVPNILSNADVGIVPKRADSFGDEAYSTKIMEFMSMGVPVVASRTKIDTYYFNDSVVRFFQSGSSDELAAGIEELLSNDARRAQLRETGLQYSREHSWTKHRQEYLALVDRLVGS